MEIISKEQFVKIMTEVKAVADYQDGLNKYYRTHGAEGYLYPPDCICTTLKLLHLVFGDKDKDEWISAFCFDYDFGQKYDNDITDKYGRVIPFKTYEDLYNLLMSEE